MAQPSRDRYDVVVIGSGFGGSVLTYRLSRAGRTVCLLERGRMYPPGSFLRGAAGVKRSFWSPDAGLLGLYDVWSFKHMVAVVASGFGGGSLIYANVLLRKPPEWFDDTWPVTYDDLESHYLQVENMIGGSAYPDELRDTTPKTTAFVDGALEAGLEPCFPKLAITFAAPGHEGDQFDDGSGNVHNAQRFACRLVGECDAGCNFGAKNTLDFTYLSQLGESAEWVALCEAKEIERANGRYRVNFVDHEERGGKGSVTAERVVIAAGALGSTYLLLRSQRNGLDGLSDALGKRFNGNGDLLSFAFGVKKDGEPRVVDPGRGPVITAVALVKGDAGRGLFLEDGGGPNAVFWMAEGLRAPLTLLRVGPRLLRLLWKAFSRHPVRELGAELSGFLGALRVAPYTLPILGMGREPANGRLELGDDGLLDLRWESGDRRAYYRRAHSASKGVADGLGARFSDLSFRINHYATSHPLGGCPMSFSKETGVVDPHGRVFGHEGGLYVVDGAAMPGPVGANPSLTIAAFANRAADALLAE